MKEKRPNEAPVMLKGQKRRKKGNEEMALRITMPSGAWCQWHQRGGGSSSNELIIEGLRKLLERREARRKRKNG